MWRVYLMIRYKLLAAIVKLHEIHDNVDIAGSVTIQFRTNEGSNEL